MIVESGDHREGKKVPGKTWEQKRKGKTYLGVFKRPRNECFP